MKLTLLNLDQKHLRLNRLMRRADPESLAEYDEQLRLSWTFHDHALEGVVLTENEFTRGVNGEAGKDVCQQLTLDSVNRLYKAIAIVRGEARDGKVVDLAYVKRMHELIAPPDSDGAGRYRKKDGPLGYYMHDSPPPRGISYRLRKTVEFIETETHKLHPVHAAVEIHRQFMQVYPFDDLTGYAGRLLLNFFLMRDGYPPAILPAGVRSSYFNALCEPNSIELVRLIATALETALDKGIESIKPRKRVNRQAQAA